VPFYGTWKDLLALVGTEAEKDVLQLFAEQLRRDLALLEQGADEGTRVAAHCSYVDVSC